MDHDEPPTGISCNPTIEQLYDFMGGNLNDVKMSQFNSHLQLCPGCDDVFHFHQGLLNMLGSSCREEIPAELRQRLLDSITKLF
jgi:mycothiol system anti-sigma-R factor